MITHQLDTYTPEQKAVYELSQKLINIQRPIRILDSIKWGPEIRENFLQNNCKKLPTVDRNYYQNKALPYNPEEKIQEFYALDLEIQKRLGKLSGIGKILQRMCGEYRAVVRMIQARGTPEFGTISQSLYGGSDDAFYVGGPSIKDLPNLLADTLPLLAEKTKTATDELKYSSDEAAAILQERLSQYFYDPQDKISVGVSDSVIADAAAGAETIKLNSSARFSDRSLRLLEVHEGWVHLGTTINGLNQPICTFLSKGPPSSTLTQEGLAIIMEIFTFSSTPARLQRLVHRVRAINMVENGADFLEVFNYFMSHGHTEFASYDHSMRVFRGSLPQNAPPFTKDLTYSKGFFLIYNYIRLAVRHGVLEQIPLLFLGKATLEDLPLFADLLAEGWLTKPKYIPTPFSDLASLSSWMCYSLFLNKFDLHQFEVDFKAILRL